MKKKTGVSKFHMSNLSHSSATKSGKTGSHMAAIPVKGKKGMKSHFMKKGM